MQYFHKYKFQIIFLLVGVQIGFFISRLPFINIEEKINVVDLLNLTVTITLAFLIAFYIEPKSQNNRIEKDIIIDNLKEISTCCKAIFNSLATHYKEVPLSEDNKNEMILKFKVLSNQIFSVRHQAEHCENLALTNGVNDLVSIYFEFKRRYTGFNFNSSTFKYNFVSLGSYQKSYLDTVKRIETLIFEVNRS